MKRPTYVLGPSPAKIALTDRATHNGTKHWPADNGHGIPHDGSPSLFRGPNIAQHATGVCYRRGAKKASEESGDHERLGILGRCGAKGKYRSDEVRYQHSGFTSVNLGEWGPYKRSQS